MADPNGPVLVGTAEERRTSAAGRRQMSAGRRRRTAAVERRVEIRFVHRKRPLQPV